MWRNQQVVFDLLTDSYENYLIYVNNNYPSLQVCHWLAFREDTDRKEKYIVEFNLQEIQSVYNLYCLYLIIVYLKVL